MAIQWAAEPRRGLSEVDLDRVTSPRHRFAESPWALSHRDVAWTGRMIEYQSHDIALRHPAEIWARESLVALNGLPVNWDSYGGQPLQAAAAEFAQQIVASVVSQGVEAPSLVPSPDGGIALEWHRPGLELVIQVPAGGGATEPVTVFFADDQAGEEWEDEFGAVVSLVGPVLARIRDYRR